jgi:glycosyltransferase involved in cell wall biosynthesis
MLVDALYRYGGAERLVAAIASALDRDRYRVTVCATRAAGGALAAQLDEAGVEYFALGREHRYDLLPIRELLRFIRSERIDVLHTHKFPSNLLGAVTRPVSRVPVLIAHEHGWSHEGGVRSFAEGRVIGGAVDAYVAGTRNDAEHLVEVGVEPSKVVVIPGAYIPRPAGASTAVRAELGLEPDTPVVGTIGVLRPEKAFDLLLEAFARLLTERPDARLVIAGDGECRADLEAEAARLGVTDRTFFLGLRDDIGAVLGSFDVAALTSDRESTSLFALECLAHDVPLVSTRVGGPREFLADGEAVLVPPRDPAALAAAFASLLDDPERARAMAAAAREKLAEFEIDAVAARHAALYDRLLAAAGR